MINGINISLRPFQPEDAENIVELKKDIQGLESFMIKPFPRNIQNEKNWIEQMYSDNVPSNIYLVIEEISSSSFVGYCVARDIDYISRNASVGIILTKSFRGKGYFKEISYVFYNYLFTKIDLHKLYSFVIKDNFVLAADYKIGFVEEGIIKEHLWQDGGYKDLVFVSLFKDNFYKIWNKGLNHFKN